MATKRSAQRLMIHVGENDRYQRRPVHTEIVRRAQAAGLAGATAFRGFEGYGLDGILHTSRILSLTSDLPVVVAIVDDPDRIEAFLPVLDELLAGGGMFTLEDIDAYYYGSDGGKDSR